MFTCEGDSAVGQTDDSTAETARFTLAMGEGRENLDIGAITASGVSGSVMAEGAGLGGAVVTLMQGGTVVANAQIGRGRQLRRHGTASGRVQPARGAAGGHALCGEYFA